MNIKCVSTVVTVFAPGRGSYESDVSYLITKGNVYQMSISRPGYYSINNNEFPEYLFEIVDEPVTLKHDELVTNEKEREQKRIQDNMDLYYCPEKYWKRQKQKERLVQKLSEVFVQGISY